MNRLARSGRRSDLKAVDVLKEFVFAEEGAFAAVFLPQTVFNGTDVHFDTVRLDLIIWR